MFVGFSEKRKRKKKEGRGEERDNSEGFDFMSAPQNGYSGRTSCRRRGWRGSKVRPGICGDFLAVEGRRPEMLPIALSGYRTNTSVLYCGI